jgi:hypothetical protein
MNYFDNAVQLFQDSACGLPTHPVSAILLHDFFHMFKLQFWFWQTSLPEMLKIVMCPYVAPVIMHVGTVWQYDMYMKSVKQISSLILCGFCLSFA